MLADKRNDSGAFSVRLTDLKSPLRGLAFRLNLIGATAALAAEAYIAIDLNVRTGPGTGFDRIGTLPADSGIDVLDCDRGWCADHDHLRPARRSSNAGSHRASPARRSYLNRCSPAASRGPSAGG
ncbi:MAG TPA: SH3 domain-containing protein [Nordella sp.]|nr:SH3 domain-containing protein [Nordella sp.]